MHLFRVVLSFVCLGIAQYLFAQGTSGEITGVVTDPSGAVVPRVNVTLTQPATNAVRVAKTNEGGLYAIPALQPEIYNLKIEAGGSIERL